MRMLISGPNVPNMTKTNHSVCDNGSSSGLVCVEDTTDMSMRFWYHPQYPQFRCRFLEVTPSQR